MTLEQIESWLRQTDPGRLEVLWQTADRVRHRCVGDEVHLRGLIELSNHCVRSCTYCGLNATNQTIRRYRMTAEQIIQCAQQAAGLGCGTVVLQAGEDYGIETQWLAAIIRRIKANTPVAVTLSLGERPLEDLQAWRDAGADRYLLRFETSNRGLYQLLHPRLPGQRLDRLDILRTLRDLGYEVGSGVMVGLPGQSFGSLAQDIDLFGRLDLDMVGVGPYIPHPHTPLARGQIDLPPIDPADQVPADELTTYKVLALTRITCPESNIPATTALATINRQAGRELGLIRGANVIMPNFTPIEYRRHYQIYPDKACVCETAEDCLVCLRERILSLGRTIGTGPGGRPRGRCNT